MFGNLATAVAPAAVLSASVAEARTCLDPEGRVPTGRSMDWNMPMPSTLWAFPRGMRRNGAAGPQSVDVGSAVSPNTFWVDLTKLDLAEGSDVRKLDLGIDMAQIPSGEVSTQCTASAPFAFEAVQ